MQPIYPACTDLEARRDKRKRDVLETQKSATRISRPETVRSLSSSSSAAAAAAAMLSGDVPPNQTVYFRNLNEKVKKEGTLHPAA